MFGGSGFYEFLDEAEEVPVETPFGPPSGRPVIGEVIVEGYLRQPQTDEELGWTDEAAIRMIKEEPW